MKALIVGDDVLFIRSLVEALLKDGYYSNIVLFAKDSIGIKNVKLEEHYIDYLSCGSYKDLIKGNILFIVSGSSGWDYFKRELESYYRFICEFVEVAKRNDIASVVLLSSFFADSKSFSYHMILLSDCEHLLKSLNFTQYIIFKPGLICENTPKRFIKMMDASISYLEISGLAIFRPVSMNLLTRKMAFAPQMLPDGGSVLGPFRILGAWSDFC